MSPLLRRASNVKRICVFCGSSPGARPEYVQAAVELGHTLAERGIGLVYGGGGVGLMGALARACLERGGEVIGVIPRALAAKELALRSLNDLRVVDSMHERKALMAELADAFIALPGGLGTLEEFFEVLTWAQLGIHDMPCGLLNVCGYYRKLIEFLAYTSEQHFIQTEHLSMILLEDSVGRLVQRCELYEPPRRNKAQWVLSMAQS